VLVFFKTEEYSLSYKLFLNTEELAREEISFGCCMVFSIFSPQTTSWGWKPKKMQSTLLHPQEFKNICKIRDNLRAGVKRLRDRSYFILVRLWKKG